MKKNMNQPAIAAEEKVAQVIGVDRENNAIILGVIEDQPQPAQPTDQQDSFDYTTVYPSLVCGNVYTKEAREAVSTWNRSARGTDASVKYPKVSVQTLDGRIIKLSYANKGQYARLTADQLGIVDAFYKKVEGTGNISRNSVHKLLCELNATLPEGQQFKLAHEIEVGLIDCLRGRKMVGFTYARRLSDIEAVMVRTLYAVTNGKELKVVYKGL